MASTGFVGVGVWRRVLRGLTATGLVVSLLAFSFVGPASALSVDPEDPRLLEPPEGAERSESVEPLPVDEAGVPASQRAEVLGPEWSSSGDVVHVALGGADGVSVVSAREQNGYEWTTTAVLPDTGGGEDLWIQNSCVTSSGRYMVVVYAPRSVTNDEDAFRTAASAAIVDLETSLTVGLGSGFTMAYYNPGCGEDDTVALTRYTDDWQTTQVAVVDATTGDVASRISIGGMATSAVSLANGDALVVSQDGIYEVGAEGRERRLVAGITGPAYDLRVDRDGRVAYAELDSGGQTATLTMVDVENSRRPIGLGSGPVTEVGVRTLGDGSFAVTGVTPGKRNSAETGVEYLGGVTPGEAVSSTGHIVVTDVSPVGFADTSADGDRATLRATVVGTGAQIDFDVTDAGVDSAVVAARAESTGVASEVSLEYGSSVARLGTTNNEAAVATLPGVNQLVLTGDPHDPVEEERYCSVPRNDPHNQAYQPKPRQVEWAVDRAVKGQLTSEERTEEWDRLDIESFSPQGKFPPVALAGGGGKTMPPQIVLGVLMNESNMWQASRYTAPGNTGNPLIGDFYGNRGQFDGTTIDKTIWDIDFADADCGYGVGQITDGMRLAGHEKTDANGVPTETSLPYDQQRLIALDYQANIAMTVRMLGQKWNELYDAGMLVNNGDPSKIENWYYALWTYNTGFHPYVDESTPWGVGWTNNPACGLYPPSRQPFLYSSQADASNPQDWPYQEKVLGWAAYGTELIETQYADSSTRTYPPLRKPSYRTARWTTDNWLATATPQYNLFCDLDSNDCDPFASGEACQLDAPGPLQYHCWFHEPVVWKERCATECGIGFERFPSSYATEESSMSESLPSETLQSSFLPDCAPAPAGVVVVDDTTHRDFRKLGECSHQPTAGSFEFTFPYSNSDGVYPAKVDLHQQGGGFNGHFYFSHMRENVVENSQKFITGTWSRGVDMTGTWTRVWVHLPDYAAWTQQAAYVIDLGDGTTETRYLPQRRYENEWVSLGVFQMNGEPKVSLSNTLTRDLDGTVGTLAGFDDVAWDAVGFEPLSAKPEHFVVALGDSYASGENAGDYAAWSDNNGSDELMRNACHQSLNSWIRKTRLPGESSPVGALADSGSDALDFHNVTCSGAQTENLLPYYSYQGPGAPPHNGENERGDLVQYGLVSQLDAGYLNADTTLVTLSIGGNDMRFAHVLETCNRYVDCDTSFEGLESLSDYLAGLLADEFPESLATTLDEIRLRAPNATIAVTGYPDLFQGGALCVSPILDDNAPWLLGLSEDLNTAIEAGVIAQADSNTIFVDLDDAFDGEGLCGGNGAISNIVWDRTPGDSDGFFGTPWGISQQSFHPTDYGTGLYAEALRTALADHD
jgi:hypothetical protein